MSNEQQEVGMNELSQLKQHFFVEWKERVIEDGMFDDEEVD